MALAQELQGIYDEAAEREFASIEEIQRVIGPPMGAEKRSIESQLAEYLTLRGNGPAWYTWLFEKVSGWEIKAAEVGIDIRQFEPWEAAMRMAVKYSAGMEAELQKRAQPSPDMFALEEEMSYGAAA